MASKAHHNALAAWCVTTAKMMLMTMQINATIFPMPMTMPKNAFLKVEINAPASSAKQRDAVPSASVFGDATAFASGNAFAAETLVGCWADFLLRDVRLALAFLAWSGGRGGCATLINAGATSRIRRWNRIAFAFGTWSSDGRAWFGLGIRRSCVGCVRDPDRQGKVGSGSD
jgi:hypothetical protein